MTQPFDPILIEVMNDLTSGAEDIGILMKRPARSLGAKEGSDFSTALVDAQGRLIAQSLTIGIHLGYIMGVMPWVLEKFHDNLHPGDVIASNDPYGGVSHFPDIVLVMPIFMVFAALVQAIPDKVSAAGEGGANLFVYTLHEERGVPAMLLDIYAPGWDARPDHHGVEGVTPMAAGDAMRSLFAAPNSSVAIDGSA